MKMNCFLRASFLENLLKGIAFLLLASMGLKAILDVCSYWDSWAYHLPFAARIWGIVPPENYILNSNLQSWYEGFGLFAEFLQGFFWYISGRPESANLVAFLSLILYIYLLRVYFKIPFYLSSIALLAIPLVQIHATASYVDLPGSIGVSVLMMMTYLLYIKTGNFQKREIIILFLGAACAANMRLKLIPIVLLFMCFAIFKISFSSAGKTEMQSRSKTKSFKRLLALLAALAIVFATAIKNTLLHGNPFYPVKIKVGSIVLNHTTEFAMTPEIKGMETVRPERWLYSIFEIIPRPFFRGD